jgi:hypothetical protein
MKIEEITMAQRKKSRWALAAERLDAEGFLDGQGDKVKGLIRDFREGFALFFLKIGRIHKLNT